MKIQGLAVIAIIIILPISVLLTSYTAYQVETLSLQISYDTRLNTATYDAVRTFQLNMSNSSTSNFTNSKMRDINAAVNIFYNSLASNVNQSGYSEDELNDYIPALVFGMYDGFYIYSKYTNTLSTQDPDDNEMELIETDDFTSEFVDGQELYGLKPYVYYSQRYIKDGDDFVITYSLDSYITIQGTIGGEIVNDAGYLLTGVDHNGTNYTYRGVEILQENQNSIIQQVYVENETGGDNIVFNGETVGTIYNLPYQKENGTKYYYNDKNDSNPDNDEVFSILNEQKFREIDDSRFDFSINDLGVQYYEEAYEFKNRLESYGIIDLQASDAVDSSGNPYPVGIYYDYPIFAELDGSSATSTSYIEDEDSEFNSHKRDVIINVMETNLVAAISNYATSSTSGLSFSMPKLTEEDWDLISTNISMISFMQGFSIGGRIYSGYSVVNNSLSQDYISEEDIYILNTSSNEYYKVTDSSLISLIGNGTTVGMLSSEFERVKVDVADKADNTNTIYYYPREELGSYSSIVSNTVSTTYNRDYSVYDFLEELIDNEPGTGEQIARIYYTALGRERMGLYRPVSLGQ